MVARFQPILPKQQITAQYLPRRINQWLKQTAGEVKKEMQEYPPVTPWKSVRNTRGRGFNAYPRTGPRAGGRRTGRYALGWANPPVFTSDSFVLVNPVPYAVYVGGPKRGSHIPGKRQALHMKDRGWNSISDVGRAVTRRQLLRLRKLILPYRNV